MPCLLAVVGLMVPRLLMVFIFFFTSWFSAAYQTIIWPLLGWLFMPYTTLIYMAAQLSNNHEVSGVWVVLMLLAIVFDICGHGFSVPSNKD